MRRAVVFLHLLVVLWLVPVALAAAPTFPALTGRVVDEAGLLGERDRAELDAALARLEQQTSDQIVVATLVSLQGLPIEDYGYQLGRHWRIGQEGKDNGALLIVAPEERAVRIEVGYGLEDRLTDAQSRLIIENEILPRLRQGDFAAGIKAGVASMIGTLGGTYDPALPRVVERQRAPAPLPLAFIVPVLLIFVLNRLFGGGRRPGRRGYRRGYAPVILPGGFGGGGSGGRSGGFGGGGGSFGGGGATGRW